ncbi:MAG TPA: hypothetical protein VHG51_03210 [Longimicrobiaceae bacterium]|nr:hypothetical protein [Longimicrobiaceae bacterium]
MSGSHEDGLAGRLDEVREAAERADTGLAQAREMEFWSDVLRSIAGGAGDAAQLARLALRTQEIDFDRLAGPAAGADSDAHAVVELRIAGTVRLRRRPPPDP